MKLKRIAAAALLTGMVGSALAQAGVSSSVGIDENLSGFDKGMPYEQTQVDRQLPNVKDPVIDPSASAGAGAGTQYSPGFVPGRPYSELEVDRTLPNVKDPVSRTQVAGPAAAAGSSAPARGAFGPGATGPGTHSDLATGPWANDWNFIAPAP